MASRAVPNIGEIVNEFVMSLPTNMDYENPNYGDIQLRQEEMHELLEEWVDTKLTHYWVDDQEVSKEEYVRAERANGFHNSMNQPDEPATSSWSKATSTESHHGRITYGPY